MFHGFAEDIAFLLIKNKVINIEQRDIYVYGIEVISLNGSLLLIFLIISILSNSLLNFILYLIIFMPLRCFTGGYHAKTSEHCFVLSVITYGATIAVIKYFPLIYTTLGGKIIGLLSVCFTLALAPLPNNNHPLNDKQWKRNRLIVEILISFDLVIFIICCCCNCILASYDLVFVSLNTFLLIIGKIIILLVSN